MKTKIIKIVRSVIYVAKQTLLGLFDAAVIIIVASIVSFIIYYRDANADLSKIKPAETSAIYDRTGTHKLYEIHGEENRTILAHGEIPDVMRYATIAAEDDAFYRHHGIDPISMIRAIKVDFETKSLNQGGSTITQQLVRNVFLNREKSWQRKIKEIVLALKVERYYSKEQILDMYLNTVPYGSNAYGVATAAQTYFGKDAKDLTLDEAAYLAALPKAPSFYSPYGNHRDELEERSKNIIRRTEDLGYVKQTEVEKVLAVDTNQKIKPIYEPIEAPHFVFYVREQLEKKYGKDFLETGGLSIYTTLDYDRQKMGEQMVADTVAYNEKYNHADNATLVALDPRNGEIITMVGSRDFFDASNDGQVNVSMRPRQPGSAFKPIVYATAFEKGYQPETLLYDIRTDFGPDGSGRDYVPRNYDGKFHGLVSMRQALGMSLNIPAIKTLYLSGVDNVIEMARRLGISTLDDNIHYGLSLAIGGGAITPLDGAAAFSVFADDGVKIPPKAVMKIVSRDGVIYTEPTGDGIRVLDPEVARKINSILTDNDARKRIFGPNSPLHIDGHTVAAKTGTSQDFRDAWTIGYTTSLVTAVWTGNNDYSPMRSGADGVFTAAPLWNKFMQANFNDFPDGQFIAYTPVKSEIKMVAGAMDTKMAYYKVKSGKKISEEKAKKMDPGEVRTEVVPADQPHDILYYVNKDTPLGSNVSGNLADPMTVRWDKALNDYLNKDKKNN